MASWNLGSVSETVLTLVEDVPIAISGALLDIVDRERLFAEQYTGNSIGSVGIEVKYQGPLVNLTIAKTTELMGLVGADAENIKLGDFSVDKGKGSNVFVVSDNLRKNAIAELDRLRQRFKFKKVNG